MLTRSGLEKHYGLSVRIIQQTSGEGSMVDSMRFRGFTSDVRVSYVLQNIEHVLWNRSTNTVQSFCVLLQEQGVKGGRSMEMERGTEG